MKMSITMYPVGTCLGLFFLLASMSVGCWQVEETETDFSEAEDDGASSGDGEGEGEGSHDGEGEGEETDDGEGDGEDEAEVDTSCDPAMDGCRCHPNAETCIEAACADSVAVCEANLNCVYLLFCLVECGEYEGCMESCVETYYPGAEALLAVLECAEDECGACADFSPDDIGIF